MKGRLKEFALKLFALTLAITISIPSNVYAIGLSKNKNKQMPTDIRIADNSEYEDDYVEESETNDDTNDSIILSETDRKAYKISHEASLNDHQDGIIYTIKVEKIKETDHDPERKMTLSLATNKNQSLRDINVKQVKDLSEDGANIDYSEEKNDKDGLKTLAITSPSSEKSIEYVLEAPIDKKAIDTKKLYSFDMSMDIDGYNIDLQRISYKFIEYENEDDPDLKELRLTSIKENKDDLRQIAYIKEDEDGKDDRIVYTDYILSKDKADEESKSLEKNKIEYKISLENIKKEDAEIKLDYYKAGEKGFEIQREFSTNIPYQEKIDLDVPAGYLLKLSLVGKVDKKNTKIQNYGVNGRAVKSPRFVKEEEKSNEDDDEDPAEKTEAESKSKDENEAEEKKAQDKKESQEKPKAEENKKTEAEKKDDSDKKTEKEEKKSTNKEDKNTKETKTEDKSEGKEKSTEENKSEEVKEEKSEEASEETSENKSGEKEENTSIKENADKPVDKNEASKKEENKTPATIEEKKEKKKEFDQLVEEKKEEAKKDSKEEVQKKSLLDGVKSFFGQTDLQKADKELKKALADDKNGLEEIQKLLTSFGEKYKLTKADQAKLMEDNGPAIKKLIEKDADKNFRPQMLMAAMESNDLVPQKIDKNGNPAGSIIESGRDDVVQIIDPGDSNYEVNTDAYANPVIKDGELQGYNWTIKISSDTDLNELGLNVNLTEVVGSGLGEFQNSNVELEDNPIKGSFGIHDSKHHAPKAGIKDITYNFYTPVQGMQEKYIMDISVILTEKKDNEGNPRVGAKRFVMNGWPKDKVKEATPIRAGMNNRTTILGEFTSESKAKWTVTDAISTGDDKGTKENPADTTLPWETRKLSDNQTLQQNGGKVAVYKIGSDGKMVQDGKTQTVSEIPGKGTNPRTDQAVGTIAVYEYNTSIKDDKEPQTLSGVAISRYEDINIDQHWNLPQGYEKLPAQEIKVVDKSGKELGKTTVNEEDGKQRLITVPNVKVWDIQQGERKFTKTQPKIVQTFPTENVRIGTKEYKYNENTSYYNYNNKNHFILNSLMEIDNKKPATFKIVKVDSKTGEKLQGASFHLLGSGASVVTDANGEATFTNIAPGSYTFKETKAPKGYKLDGENKTITISDNGEVSVSGKNADFSQAAGKTEVVEHNNYPNYPDYMNAMHYGKVDENGDVEFYLYLKPIAPRQGGGTDRNTRLDISIPGVNITDVKAYDVSPGSRPYVKSAMEGQTANNLQLGNNAINVNHKYKITGAPNTKDAYTGREGHQIYFPKERFAGDWGFLVKVKANIGQNNSASLYYDWLTHEDTANQAHLQKIVRLSKNPSGADDKPTITIKNTPFEKKPIEVVKFANTFTNGKRDRLSGAEFVLKDSEGNVISNKITDENGKASFGDYPEGRYIVEEVKAPDGYEKNGVYFEVEVNESQEVRYTARFENSSATPQPGQDYFIDKGEEIGGTSENIVTSVNQWLDYNEGQAYSRGERPNVWEAYRYESLKYHADISLSSSSKGDRFEIQFDPNLDFTQYFNGFPKLRIHGKEVADPYFNYETNLLTYVFNEKTDGGPATATIDLIGMIPSKYYAKNTGTYPFTITVQPNQTGISGQTHHKDIKAFFDAHDSGHNEPVQNYYFREIYEENGEYYVDVISYYNVIGDRNPYKKVNPKTLNYNWITTKFQGGNITDWVGEGTEPRQVLDRVKIYRTEANVRVINNDFLINDYMPLSMGFRAEQEPNIYRPVFNASVDPNQNATISQNGITLIYDKDQINPNGKLIDNKNQPLKIKMPSINNGEGYVIEQRFKIPDIDAFNNKWRAFVMNNGNLKSAFASGANKSFAKGDQTGGETPKYYKEEVGVINKKYTPGQFKIIKSNESDNSKLAGATFELTDANNNTIYRTSGNDGELSFTNLAPGSYTLKETRAPDNFIKSEKRWAVNVYSDGSVRITQIGIAGSDESYFGNNENIIIMPVSNKPSGAEFRVYKKDSDGKALQGAEFTITKENDPNFQAIKKSSNENGLVEFESLGEGTYIIEESQAPAGYKELDKKWVLVIDKDGNQKVYNYRENSDTTSNLNSILEQNGVNWVDVAGRSLDGWELYDNRYTGWTGNNVDPFKMGTRIVGINRKDKYVIQRYVINPEAAKIGETNATIHREKPKYPNMDWYKGDETYQVYKLNKPVTGVISDIRLAEYGAEEITKDVKGSAKAVPGKYNEPNRLSIDLPATDKPLVIDVKVPYKEEFGGVGTGMDWTENGTTYWKSDYYESASVIKEASPVVSTDGNIIGSYVGEGSLDVTNEFKTFDFKIKKVKDNDNTKAIEGAKFRLTGPGEGGEEREITTGKDGIISFDKLRPGIYKLEEIEPAPGYEKTDETWIVTITQDGKSYIKSNKTSEESTNRVEKSEELAINRARYSLLDRIQTSDTNNTGLEIGPTLPDTRNPLGANTTKIDYEFSNLKDNDRFKNQIDVTSSVEYLGNDEFKVRYDMKNITGSTLSNKRFEVAFDDNATFVGGSTHTWKWSIDGENGNPNNPENASRWHSGYDSNTKKIGIRDNELTIPAGDTASITFKVKVRSNLGINGVVNLVRYIRYDGANITPYPRAKKVKLYAINYDAEGGTIVTEPMDWAEDGLVEIIDVSPKAGYRKISGPTVRNNTTGRNINIRNDKKFPMQASDVTVSAKFEANTYKVNKGKIENGSINVPASAKTDQVVNITDIKPSDGYKLDKITVIDSNKNPIEVTNNTFKMPAGDVTVNAKFEKIEEKTYKVIPNVQENGTVSAEPNQNIKAGDTVTLTLKPDNGYALKTLEVNSGTGKKVETTRVNNNTYTFIMPESNVGVNVYFEEKQTETYSITVKPSQSGSVTADKETAKANGTVTLTVTPEEGFEIKSVTMNGQALTAGADGKYSFTMPASNVTVSATFKKKPITPPGGSVEIPADGYKITNKQVGLDLKIFKRDSNSRPLEGGKFTLKKTDENYTKEDPEFKKIEGISGTDGKLVFTDSEGKQQSLALQPGYYVLEETESPSGYKKAQAPWKIHVYEDKETNQLKAEYQGPDETPNSFIKSDKALDNFGNTTGIKTTKNGIKYAARMTNINTEGKTYIQRIYIDTRKYNGPVNVQIKPVEKREEIDTPGQTPVTTKEGVKTAYRSTYEIKGLAENPTDAKLNDIFRNYTIANDDVSVVNTARWRPFDWGFDEDQLNLDPGVYYIDVEGFYDDNITKEDIGKIEMNVDFMTPRYFWQADGLYPNGDQRYKLGGSYQAGAETFGSVYQEDTYVNGELKKKGTPTPWGASKPTGQKYQNWLSKEFTDIHGDRRYAGIVAVPNGSKDKTIDSVTTSINIRPLYTSTNKTQVGPEGMDIVNDEETYNITFSKHGRDDKDEDVNSEEVTKRRLEGAVFKLQEYVINGYKDVEGSTISSAFNGYFGFRGLKPGRYQLIEVKAPEGYKPINGPLLQFTVETIKTNSGKIVDPETGNIIDIKTIKVKFPGDADGKALTELYMTDPKDSTKKIQITNVDSKEINMETIIYKSADATSGKPLKELILVVSDDHEYPIEQIKIVDGSSGYISLEYDKANGVYQYVPEKSTSEKDGKLVDFVTSATAKNMGKIINEKPGKGEITVKKVDQKGDTINATDQLPGAKFKLTNKSTGSSETKTVGADGTLKFTGLQIGDYRLEEVKSPDGYINNKQVWNFTVGGEGLDPYANDASQRRRNVSSSIEISESNLSVLNPNSKNEGLLSDNQKEMHPHLGEVFEFDNKYTIDSDLKINPGDFFVLKLSDNIDLHGIMESRIDNLDIYADGVGTIAKAEYDRENNQITYTFTEYANTYNLVEFSNKLKAYINLNKVPKEGQQSIERGVVGHEMKTDNIKVVYDSMTAREKYMGSDGYWYERTQNYLNLGSKIIKFNPDTGEFVHYYYVNRDRSNTARSTFYYKSDQNIENLNIDYYFIGGNKDNAKALMPDSFGVNEDKLPAPERIRSRSYLGAGQEVSINFSDGLNSNSSYILKVTGKVSGKDKSSYVAHGMLEFIDNPGRYVTRWDGHYAYKNDATAKANLQIQAVNPENIIKFKKVDQDGKALQGAKFQLQYKNNEGQWLVDASKDKTSGEDGVFEYTKLKPGSYRVMEISAPDGYKKAEDPVAEFDVDENGRIIRKDKTNNPVSGTAENASNNEEEDGTKPIEIVNKKEQKISFVKVDASDKKPLAGAEFEVWYKAKKEDKEYTKLKLYEKTADGKTKRLAVKEGENFPTGFTPVKEDKFTTGEDGLVEFNFYDSGYYGIKEVKAPKGYIAPKDFVKEFIYKDGKLYEARQSYMSMSLSRASLMNRITFGWYHEDTYTLTVNPDNMMIDYPKADGENSKSILNLSGFNSGGTVKVYLKAKGKEVQKTGYVPTFKFTNNQDLVIDLNKAIASIKAGSDTTGTTDIKSDDSIVLEIKEETSWNTEVKRNIKLDIKDKNASQLISENKDITVEASFASGGDNIYYGTKKFDSLPEIKSTGSIEIENTKVEYPFTGGPGVWIGFAIIGLIVMLGGVLIYTKKKKEPVS